jgi:hypothetical protein
LAIVIQNTFLTIPIFSVAKLGEQVALAIPSPRSIAFTFVPKIPHVLVVHRRLDADSSFLNS